MMPFAMAVSSRPSWHRLRRLCDWLYLAGWVMIILGWIAWSR